MPSLDWIGKQKVINHHLDVPYRILEAKENFNTETESGNKIIKGDNLAALKSLLPEYEGKIKCIYIDPPYNTGNEQWVYNDNVNSPKIQKWLGEVVGKEGEDLTRHDKWLCMMYPRLKLLHRLLADDGAIFISIDEVEQANLKIICDEIFGAKNFIGIYNWFKSATPPNLSHKIKKNIEYVLSYSKTSNSNKFYGVQKISKSDDPIIKPQNTLKVLTFPIGSLNTKIERGIYKEGIYGTDKYPNELLNELIIENYTNTNEVSFKNRFIWVQEKLNEELSNNTQININFKSLVISYKKSSYDNEVPPNLIDESVGVTTTENAGRLLLNIFGRKVFDYPKPPSLVQYIINFLCDKNSLILDSFAGSGTTAHAVLNLNKEDGGNRKFILIEMEDYADTITAERVRRVIKGYGEGNKAVEGTGGDFTFYELGEPMFIENNEILNENLPLEEIRKYVYYTETGSIKTYQAQTEGQHAHYLGHHHQTDYYFHYQKSEITYLDTAFLNTIRQKADGYVIYADVCALSEELMRTYNIVFKKIPRDITRL